MRPVDHVGDTAGSSILSGSDLEAATAARAVRVQWK